MQTNLPVSLHLPEAYRFYASSRSCTSSNDCFIFGITLFLSPVFLSLGDPDLSHTVMRVVFLHCLIFIRVFKHILAHLIMHYFVF